MNILLIILNFIEFSDSNHEILMKAFDKSCVLLIYINFQHNFILFTEFIWVSLLNCVFQTSKKISMHNLIFLVSNDVFYSLNKNKNISNSNFFFKEIVFFLSSKIFNSESKNLIFLSLNVWLNIVNSSDEISIWENKEEFCWFHWFY